MVAIQGVTCMSGENQDKGNKKKIQDARGIIRCKEVRYNGG